MLSGPNTEFRIDSMHYRFQSANLMTCSGVDIVGEYVLPSSDEVLARELESILCENCIMDEQCNRPFCIFGSKTEDEVQIRQRIKNH